LRDIVRYISSQLSAPVTAAKMMDEIEKALSEPTDMPQRCPPVTDERLNAMGYRKLIINNYIAFFVVDEKAKVVNIVQFHVHVHYTAQITDYYPLVFCANE